MPSTVRIEIDSSIQDIARVQRALGEGLTEHGVATAWREQLAVGEAPTARGSGAPAA